MKRALLLSVAVALLGSCAGGDGAGTTEYDNNDLELITAFTAKSMCSCLFVMEMDEAYCKVWSKQSPAVADFRIDHQNKTVESGALLFWMKRARYVDDTFGCELEQ